MKKNTHPSDQSKIKEIVKSIKQRFDETLNIKEKLIIIKEFENYCQSNEYLQYLMRKRYSEVNLSNDVFEIAYFSRSLEEIIDLMESN